MVNSGTVIAFRFINSLTGGFMDIKEINNGTLSTSVINNDRRGETAKIEFQKALEEAKSSLKTEPSSLFPSSPKSGGEIPLNPALTLQNLEISLELEKMAQIRSQGIQGAESALDLLDQYQEALGDSGVALKKVDRLVQHLSQGVDDLNALSEKLPTSDPLQKIMKEIGIVSTVEIEKFKRGEYI